jgi:hypothetical protein
MSVNEPSDAVNAGMAIETWGSPYSDLCVVVRLPEYSDRQIAFIIHSASTDIFFIGIWTYVL